MKVFCLHYSQNSSQLTSPKLLGETRIFYDCKVTSGYEVLQIDADGLTLVKLRLALVEVL